MCKTCTLNICQNHISSEEYQISSFRPEFNTSSPSSVPVWFFISCGMTATLHKYVGFKKKVFLKTFFYCCAHAHFIAFFPIEYLNRIQTYFRGHAVREDKHHLVNDSVQKWSRQQGDWPIALEKRQKTESVFFFFFFLPPISSREEKRGQKVCYSVWVRQNEEMGSEGR